MKVKIEEFKERVGEEAYNNLIVRIINKMLTENLQIKQGTNDVYSSVIENEKQIIIFDVMLYLEVDVIKVMLLNINIDEKL